MSYNVYLWFFFFLRKDLTLKFRFQVDLSKKAIGILFHQEPRPIDSRSKCRIIVVALGSLLVAFCFKSAISFSGGSSSKFRRLFFFGRNLPGSGIQSRFLRNRRTNDHSEIDRAFEPLDNITIVLYKHIIEIHHKNKLICVSHHLLLVYIHLNNIPWDLITIIIN